MTGTDGEKVESCMRLGVAHADEEIVYKKVTSSATKFLQLDDRYSKDPGIAMLTPGTINLIASEGVNMVSNSNSMSTSGSTYAVTADPKTDLVISAALLDKKFGGWVTESFTRASTVSVSTNFQTAFSLTASYAFSGGLTLSNIVGVSFTNVLGISINQSIGMGISIDGWAMTTTVSGETYDYGSESNECMARKHKFGIIEPSKQPVYAVYEKAEKAYVVIAQGLAIAASAASAVYAATVAGLAQHQPSKVKSALHVGEDIGIACIVANALVTAASVILGIIQIAAQKAVNATPAGTSFEMAKDKIALEIKPTTKALVEPTKITLEADATNFIHLSTASGVEINASANSIAKVTPTGIELSFGGGNASVKLDSAGLTLTFGTNKIEMTATGIKITGPAPGVVDIAAAGVDIKGTTLSVQGAQVAVK